ncbi:flagellar export chaperone FlgN [Natranaerofaba carboxydovora]|uniref:flagellar export chaperone FlgN n=1 Tax=Natranaerofaba carboxydovora TaxID=2742683 RepID=UPI001F13BAD2|nr:flagellar export chaperone FlgN [Natranaerofaba carboxydovora]UMZ74988.1 FlgN protein [Natranaerofaba carboxydovora]
MKELQNWQELLEKYNKTANKYLKVLDKQLQYLKEEDIESFMSLFNKKKRTMNKMSDITPQLKEYKEKWQEHAIPEPYKDKINNLREENKDILRTAEGKVKELEKLIGHNKKEIEKELSKTKRDRKVVNSYHPEPRHIKEEGVFFDKKS